MDLGKKTDLSTRKASLDQIVLAVANPRMSYKNSKTHKNPHVTILLQFIKQGQNKCEGRTVIAKALSGY